MGLCKKFFLVMLFLLSFTSATCQETQIDINSASFEELQNITQIGPDFAEQIIDLRPFDSVDDLVLVSGIAEGRLEKIKEENLACVDEEYEEIEKEEEEKSTENQEEDSEDSEKEDKEESEEKDKDEEDYYDNLLNQDFEEKVIENKTPVVIENEVIDLFPQNIKSEDYTENLSKEDYAKYGLGLFCVFLFGLFGVKKFKISKNEFR